MLVSLLYALACRLLELVVLRNTNAPRPHETEYLHPTAAADVESDIDRHRESEREEHADPACRRVAATARCSRAGT